MRIKSIIRLTLIAICVAVIVVGMADKDVGAQLQADESDEATVFINKIIFEGNTVIDTQTLEKVTEPYTNRELTLEEMSDLVDMVTITYQEQGYILARAYLPRQDIQEGVLRIAIVEGHIGKIEVGGKTHYKDDVIKRYFKQQLKHGVVKESLIEKGLLLSSDLPEVKTDVVLKKGEEPGSVDVMLNTEDSSDLTFGVKLSFDYNNYGSPIVSEHRFSTAIELMDHKWGTVTSLRGSTGDNSDDTLLGRAGISIPINSYGTKVSGYYLASDYTIGEEFADLGLTGDSISYGGTVSHPLIIEKNKNLSISLGFDRKRIENETEDFGVINIDRIIEWNLSLNYDHLDRFLGKNIASLGLYSGKIIDFEEEGLSRLEVNERFERIRLNLARIQKVYGYTNLLLRGSGQYSNDRLLPMEQAAIGGYGSVRGAEPSSLLGDYGYNLSAELMLAPPFIAEKTLFGQRIAQMVQLVAFYDHAKVYINDETEDEFGNRSLTGFGGGIRLFYKNLFTFKYDIAFPYKRDTEETDDIYHYFAASVQIF